MKPRVGVFNVGFHRYWPQFSGLKRTDRSAGAAKSSQQRVQRPRSVMCWLFAAGVARIAARPERRAIWLPAWFWANRSVH
jgi:hypothetical protein